MRRAANSFLVAVLFLTRIPVPRMKQFAPDALAKSVAFFPLVGLLVAAGGVLLNSALSLYVSRGVVVLEKRAILGGKLSSWHDRDGDVRVLGNVWRPEH